MYTYIYGYNNISCIACIDKYLMHIYSCYTHCVLLKGTDLFPSLFGESMWITYTYNVRIYLYTVYILPRHPVIFSADDWGVQSPSQHSISVIGSLGTVSVTLATYKSRWLMIFSGATKQVARYLTPRPGNPIWTSEYAHVIYLEVYTSIWDALPKKKSILSTTGPLLWGWHVHSTYGFLFRPFYRGPMSHCL